MLRQFITNNTSNAVDRELVKEGEKLSDMLSMPVKDAIGRELSVDYTEDIINIRDILDATEARKNIFSDSVEIQKLTLEQMTYINNYERDVVQAIKWLDELFQVMLRDHGHVGCTVYEIQGQKEEQQMFQETAKDTYNYGCQLLNASLSLRQTCKLPTEEHTKLFRDLRLAWQRLLSVNQEQMTRLRVSAVFHRSIEEHCNQLRDLREAVAMIPLMDITRKKSIVKHYFNIREELMVEVGRMVRLGRLLRSRLKEHLHSTDKMSDVSSSVSTDLDKLSDYSTNTCIAAGNNEVAIEAISERLTEVTGLTEELDQTLHSAQQDCSVFITATELQDYKKTMDSNSTNISEYKPSKPEDLKSDEEFQTASECTLQHSRSSSYNTASECEHRFSPWWEYHKSDLNEDISKEKMVLTVGLFELPAAKSVLKPSPEVPPGKIVHEVTETTHIKVNHQHTLGVSSFVLTSETVGDKKNDTFTNREEVVRVTDGHGKEVWIPIAQQVKVLDEEEFVKRIKECGDWANLKIIEITPEITALGANLAEVLELQKAHDEVLRQLQNKQSPVEELLRQADQLIATQRPRAEVYAAMAESLGRAWKDININLELRKQILDLNVQYHIKAQDFFERMDSLQTFCADTLIPIEIEAVKQFLTNIHELRRSLLESLMGALQAGNSLLVKLKKLGAESTLDSRPDQIRNSVKRAISQVQNWLDELHIRRQVLESTFNRRNTQLEQCLALAILASDLRELEEIIFERRELLAHTDQLGDSASCAELLQHEHKKFLPEARQLQERALKITKATEHLVTSGCFAGEQATAHSYDILSASSDYLTDLQNRDNLLERVMNFFRSTQSALTKLEQLEIQLATTVLPPISPQLVQMHAQCAKTIEEITASPIEEGHSILDSVLRGTDGIKRKVEELENKKIYISSLCVAHLEENMRINNALANFLEKQNEIYTWLVMISKEFLQGRQDMGSDLSIAKDFFNLHNNLLHDLQTKGNEINALLLTLPPILEYLEDNQRKDVDTKVEGLHERWMKLKTILENRLDLARVYVKFHMEADIVNKEMDNLEVSIRNRDNIDEDSMKKLEEEWESLVPLYESAKNTGLTFITQANKVSEPYLDTKRACVCVESVLERLSGRQLLVTRNWQTFHTEITEKRELLVHLEETMAESTKTINWVSKLDSQLYPVITTNTTIPKEIALFLKNKQKTIVPDIKRAQNEVEQRMKTAEQLISKSEIADEKTVNVKNKLFELNQKLVQITTDYQILLQVLIEYFNHLNDLDNTIDSLNQQFNKAGYPNDKNVVESLIKEHEASNQAVLEMFKFTKNKCDNIIDRIKNQQPAEAANQDIEKLKYVFELFRTVWENQWKERRVNMDSHKQLCQFDNDLNQINITLDELREQLKGVKGQYGESIASAKGVSQTFVSFERTIEMLDVRIKDFINTGVKLLFDKHKEAPHIQKHISDLQDRWNNFKLQIQDTRKQIDLSIQYFQLIEQVNEWFREGNHLLVSIARRSTEVKQPKEAESLLNEMKTFLKPGEESQNIRIHKISELAKEIYGPQSSQHVQKVVDNNNEMLQSFASIRSELNVLISNLQLAEKQRVKLLKEQEEANVKLAATKAEVAAAEAATAAAEEAKRAAEKAAKALEDLRLLEEAKMLEEHKLFEEARLIEEATNKVEAAHEVHHIKIQKEKSPGLVIEEVIENEEPKFHSPLSDAVIQEGSKFSFICQVTGVPQPEVTWYKDGISIQNNPDYKTSYIEEICTLTIEETFTEDSAKYTCKAANEVGESETSAILSVKETEPEEQLLPPTFVKLLESVNPREGATFQFECKVEGLPLPTVQWFKDVECIDNSPDYIITYNNGEAILKFEKVCLDDKAEYTCKATNELGIAQTTASLSVTPLEPTVLPRFVVPLSNVMARAGQKIKLECEVSGLPTPILTWSHNGKPVKETRELKLQHEDSKETLVIFEAFPKDAGTYTVSAKNVVGEAFSACSVSVKGRLPNETSDSELASDMEPVKPSIQLPLSNVTIPEGNRVRLDCVIVGQPEPEVIWYHDDRPVKESSDFQLLFQGDRCSLVIQEAFSEDAGEYKVVALNSAGEASSKCILTVATKGSASDSDKPQQAEKVQPLGIPPKFTKLLADVLVSEGEKVIFEGNVTGDPQPEIKWLLNNIPIPSTDHVRITHEDSGNIKLEIGCVNPEDKGVYTVKATNSLGVAKCFAQLIVKSLKAPETIIHDELKSIPIFKELFYDRIAFEETPTKFECIVVGKPNPKIKWLFNGNPISGNNFLVSTSGERQVLSIPKLNKQHEGTITCVAENEVGKASCAGTLTVQSTSAITLPEDLYKDVEQHLESSYMLKREVVTQSSTSSSSKVVTASSENVEPHVQVHSYKAQNEQTFKQVNQEQPQLEESHKIEEYTQIGKEVPIISEKSSTMVSIGGEAKQFDEKKTIEYHELIHNKPTYKSRPPKFISPVIGQIVDKDANIILEGILDGQPTPEVTWSKNGASLTPSANLFITWTNNRAAVEIKKTSTNDSGRYTCTAVNEAGSAISTADLIVRKTIFPPVFGRRLQAQVIKKGDRINMEVEVTGTPDPEVTWFKDGIAICDAFKEGYKIKTSGNMHTIVIEKADLNHTGRYMVRAVNPGGEAQSIADIAVFEPTPETMLEVVKTVVFEDVKKHETLTSAAEKVSSTATTPKPIISVEIPKPTVSEQSFLSDSQVSSQSMSQKSELSSIMEQKTHQEFKTVKLIHKVPEILMPKPIEMKQEPESVELKEGKKLDFQETGIESSSISKQSSLQYFVKKIKQGEELLAKEISLTDQFKPAIYCKFEEVSQKTDIIPQIKQEIKMPSVEQYQSFSSSQKSEQFQLKPEPPPEICYSETPSQNSYLHEEEKKNYQEKSHETSLSSYSSLFERTKQFVRPSSVVPTSSERQDVMPRPISSMDSIQMKKQWTHKFTDNEVDKPWLIKQNEEPKLQSYWPAQSSFEKKWTPIQSKSEIAVEEFKSAIQEPTNQAQVPYYIGEVSKLSYESNILEQQQSSYSKREQIIEQSNVKPSEIVKSWPPQKPVPTIEFLSIRPVSVQDITDEVYLEPGPPPEIGYAQPPPTREQRKSYVEIVEQKLEREPAKEPSYALCTIPPQKYVPPPPLPPKKELPQAPPLPAKTFKAIEQQPLKKVISASFQRFPDLEPFPFKPDPQKPPPLKVGPPPTPSKFIKGKFTDSDYESDFEAVRIAQKWRPCRSDSEETSYRRVRAPNLLHAERSRSIEPEPLPPSKFDRIPQFQGPPRPNIDFEICKQKKSIEQIKKQTKQFTKAHEIKMEAQPSQVFINPGSPPIFVEPEQRKKPDSPKTVKQKMLTDGYTADTDEPLIQQHKKFSKTTEFRQESKTEFRTVSSSSEKTFETSQQRVPTKTQYNPPHKIPQHKKHVSSVSSFKKELVATPIITTSTTKHILEEHDKHTQLGSFPFKLEQHRSKKSNCQPPPSPSKFVKGEFRESDYESDYEGRILPIWRSTSEPSYKPIKPVLTPTGRQSQQSYGRTPTPPTEFEIPSQIDGPSRPKFEPIEKIKPSVKLEEILKTMPKPTVFKPKPVQASHVSDMIIATPAVPKPIILEPGSPPEISYAAGPQKKTQCYRSTTSAPYHNAVQTETSNFMHFNESTGNSHRHVSLQQTKKVITFGDKSHSSLSAKNVIPGEFRESDYESEVEGTKIKPKWTPGGSDTEDLQYRKVRAPAASRSSNVPATKQRILTPMEFDTQPPIMPTSTIDYTDGDASYKKFSENKSGHQMMQRSRSYEQPTKSTQIIRPGAPPEYGYISDQKITKSNATKIASDHMDNMTQAFKSKTQQFVSDVMADVDKQKTQKPILKSGEYGEAQVYREESRAAQYGTKHVDPATGLIYFKYDFGYEFGIILPGESKSGQIPVPKKTVIEPPRRTKDIEMPVFHETTKKTQNNAPTPQFQPKKFTSKNVKWEPTSESEMSEYEGEANRKRCNMQGSRWEQSSCSPVSLSPSLPSTSPAFNNNFAGRRDADTPPSCPSTPGSYTKGSTQARAPLFITPLRNIAVMSGQAAKFECIVQSEPVPNILWSKNGRIIQNCNDCQVHYRNGVCRLTISHAYPEDAGTYSCTASNSVGTVNTAATLQVPGERRSTYIK